MFLISALLYSFAGSIIELLLGDKYYKSVLLLKIMSFLPFIISLSNIFGIQTMLNLGYKKEFSFFILITAVISIISAFILIPMYSEVGASISLLIGELSITIILGLFVLIKIK
jgi:PST family polysaccharide transporter